MAQLSRSSSQVVFSVDTCRKIKETCEISCQRCAREPAKGQAALSVGENGLTSHWSLSYPSAALC